jgi:ATP-dependent 26S proteasome regulatory subunit
LYRYVGGSCGGGGFGGEEALPGGWETLAGAEREVQVLKELALLPLVYPEAFAALGVNPGRGVLLHG